MTLTLLFKDELKGFYKSKVMLLLWVILPLLSLVLRQFQYYIKTEGTPFSFFSAFIISSLGGTLAAVMLTVSIINEKNQGVYDLYLIRPVKRRDILFSKFFSVYLCIAMAGLISQALGIALGYINGVDLPDTFFHEAAHSFLFSFSMLAISSSAGILIGVAAPSVLVGVILVLYGGNQMAVLPMIPVLLKWPHPSLISVVLGATLAFLLLAVSIVVFNKRQF